jgi:GDP-L-fucose synthase
MNVLVLGATGFLGQNVTRTLKRNTGINLIETSQTLGADLTNYDQAIKLFKKSTPDYIINCAAHVGSLNYVTQMAADVILDNTRMILNMYEAVAKCCHEAVIINPVANCAYPASAGIFSEGEWMSGHLHRSVLSFGATRRLLWHVGESFYMQHQIKSIYLFVPNMYGPFDSTDPNKAHALNALIARFVKAEREGSREITLWGTGIAIREWLYAEDFADVVNQILNKRVSIGLDEPLNIGQNFGLSVRELSNLINKHFYNKFRIEWDHKMPDGTPKKVMDDRRFRKVFPDFNFKDLNEGISETIRYYDSIYPY